MELTPHTNIDLRFEPSRLREGKYLVLDTETTGLIKGVRTPETEQPDMPRILQVAWLVFDAEGKLISSQDRYISQDSPVPAHSTKVHGISDLVIHQHGERPEVIWNDFIRDLEHCEFIVAHHIEFDLRIIESELTKLQIYNPFAGKRKICTMKLGREICRIPAHDGNGFRYPALDEMYKIAVQGKLTDPEIIGLHNAMVDASIAAKIFFSLLSSGKINLQDAGEEPFRLSHSEDLPPRGKRKFFFNVILPTLLTMILFILTSYFIILPWFRESIMVEKKIMIKELTQSAYSILEKYGADEAGGKISLREAKEAALSGIRGLRYGDENKDYFWITDHRPFMVMHPYRPGLEGKSLEDFADPHGKLLFVDMVRVAKGRGSGYVEYMWQWKDDPARIVPKLSYVKYYEPWGWVIGTGIYLEDVKQEIDNLMTKLLIITTGISLIIALLLTYITMQSLKIEKKRKTAESLLRISREKYKTLVDATTEGLILLIDAKMIFVNNRILEMTGYRENDLINQSFGILISGQNPDSTLRMLQSRDLPAGQHEVLLVKKDGEPMETLLTVSPILFYEKKGRLISVKDSTIRKYPAGTSEEIIRLLEIAGIGFIRVMLSGKGRILHATRSAVKLLGFHDFKELEPYSILDFFADPDEKKRYRNLLIKEGRITEAVIHLKRTDMTVIKVSVSMMVTDREASSLICDGVIADITEQSRDREEAENIIFRLKSQTLLLQSPVNQFLKPAPAVPLDMPATRVIEMMHREGADAMLVSDCGERNVGIVTTRDIVNRVLLTDQDFSKPAYRIMSAPLTISDNNATVDQALMTMENSGISHLPLSDITGMIMGLVHKSDINGAVLYSIAFIESGIDKAHDVSELVSLFTEFSKHLGIMARKQVDPGTIGSSLASVSDRITRRLIAFAIDSAGPPPVDFAFIALGSEARMEQSFATDQDNAIIYADIPESETGKVQAYFNRLGEIVCEHLNTIGFHYCKGRIMASNPRWNKPLGTWKHYFSQWAAITEPKNMMEISIFFDMRTIYGSEPFVDELRRHIEIITSGNGSFFFNLAESVLSVRPLVGLTGGLHTEKLEDKELLDLKAALTPFIMFGRIYSIRHKIRLTNTTGRFQSLQAMQVLPPAVCRELLFGYHLLMQIRYRNQAGQIEKGEVAGNTLDLQELPDAEVSLLKKIITATTAMQNQLNIDFKRSVL